VERKTTVVKLPIKDTETTIKQNEEDIRKTENAGLTCGKPEK
jgi:hypothetical protein